MVRGESVAVIYLSLLVCLFLGQGTEGRGTTHNTIHLELTTQTLDLGIILYTVTDSSSLKAYNYSVPPLPSPPLPSPPLPSPPLPQVLVSSRGRLYQTMTPPALPLRCCEGGMDEMASRGPLGLQGGTGGMGRKA